MIQTKTTWHHLRRSPFQSLAAFFITSLSFFVIVAYIILSFGISATMQYFQTKPEITIFLKDGLERSQVEGLQQELASYSNIKEIKFISKEQALSLYRQQNSNNPLLTEMVTASILPASFEVSATDPKMLKTISDNFSQKTNLVEEIVFEQDIVNALITWVAVFRQIGLITSISLLLTSFVIILVIIGMKVTSHKDEIKISRLLGASRLYVESPFVFEGIIYGILGSLAGTFSCFILAFYLRPRLNLFFQPIVFISTDPLFFLILAIGAVTGGTLIGYFSSWSSVRRFIKF